MLIVIEGLDRVGKTTLIFELQKEFSRTLNIPFVIHCSKPKCNPEDVVEFQKKYYAELMLKTIPRFLKHQFAHPLILDRSWIGEHIWSKFRGGYDTEFIDEYEEEMIEIIGQDNIHFFLLEHHQDYLQFHYKDDGESLFKTYNEMSKCFNMFRKEFEMTSIHNSHIIQVSNELGFRKKDDILEEVLDCIGYSGIGEV